jgi:hypothetical protein
MNARTSLLRRFPVMFVVLLAACATPTRAQTAPRAELAFGDAFWKAWGDGKAELASYELRTPRYGAERRGTAVAIFVTETFDPREHVKQEQPRPDGVPVIKLNLVQDFATGIYDYNLMTSVFVALKEHDGRPAGSLCKASFGAQEWCGHVYDQVVLERDGVRRTAHSYFGGEGDRSETLPARDGALAEDALLLWARGLAGPHVAAGARASVPLLRSLEVARLQHVALTWDEAQLSREKDPVKVEVPAGAFTCDVARAEITRAGGAASAPGAKLAPARSWTIHVERDAPHRVVRFETSDGKLGELVASARLEYWKLNQAGGEAELAKLGLAPRPPRTP